MEEVPSEESTWLKFIGIRETPTLRNSGRKLMLIEFTVDGDDEFQEPEYFTWAPKWKDVVNIVIRALFVEHRNTSRKSGELIKALRGAGALRTYLVQKKSD